MIYWIVLAVLIVGPLVALRIHIRRDEAWLSEQARIDEQARRSR